MSVLQIQVLGAPVLRQKARRVTRFDASLRTLAQDMVETMREANGAGLAAPQVGVPARLIVVETPQDPEEPGGGQLYVIVNPQVIRASQEEVEGIEGCLSVPGYVGEVRRHQAVTVRGLDLHGRRVRIKAQGFLARVLQHEIDHLDGVLYIDRLTAPDRIWRVQEGDEEQAEVPGAQIAMTPTMSPLV